MNKREKNFDQFDGEDEDVLPSSKRKKVHMEDDVAQLLNTQPQNLSILACQALSIVLQKLMVPDLGWSVKALQQHQLILKKKLVDLQIERLQLTRRDPITTEEKQQHTNNLETNLSSSGMMLQMPVIQDSVRGLQNLNTMDLLPPPLTEQEIRTSLHNTETSEFTDMFSLASLHSAVGRIFRYYRMETSMVIQYQLIMWISEARQSLLDLFHTVASLFSIQQTKCFKQSLICYQLCTYSKWKHRIEAMEVAAFAFSTVPMLLQQDEIKFQADRYLRTSMFPRSIGPMNVILFNRTKWLENCEYAKGKIENSQTKLTKEYMVSYRAYHSIVDAVELLSHKLKNLSASYHSVATYNSKNSIQELQKKCIGHIQECLYFHVNCSMRVTLEDIIRVKSNMCGLMGMQRVLNDVIFDGHFQQLFLIRSFYATYADMATIKWSESNRHLQDLYSILSKLFHVKIRLIELRQDNANLEALLTGREAMIDQAVALAFEGLALYRSLSAVLVRCGSFGSNICLNNNLEECLNSLMSVMRLKLMNSIITFGAAAGSYLQKLINMDVTDNVSVADIQDLTYRAECYGLALGSVVLRKQLLDHALSDNAYISDSPTSQWKLCDCFLGCPWSNSLQIGCMNWDILRIKIENHLSSTMLLIVEAETYRPLSFRNYIGIIGNDDAEITGQYDLLSQFRFNISKQIVGIEKRFFRKISRIG